MKIFSQHNAARALRPTRLAASAAVLMVALAGAAAALGGTSSASPAAASHGARVSLGKTALGRVLVDARGRTLYPFEKDTFGQSSAIPTLQGTVGPGFTITLNNKGTKVKTLKAGKYLFVLADKASIHNFTLQRGTGGGKALTGVPFVGTKRVLVALTKGKWKYYCTPHESIMFGFFTVK